MDASEEGDAHDTTRRVGEAPQRNRSGAQLSDEWESRRSVLGMLLRRYWIFLAVGLISLVLVALAARLVSPSPCPSILCNLDRIDNLVSVGFVEGPICGWLLSRASTRYLKKLALYVTALWLLRCLSLAFMLFSAFQMWAAQGVTSTVYYVVFALQQGQMVRLVLGRVAALEKSSFQDLKHRQLRISAGCMVCFSITTAVVLHWFVVFLVPLSCFLLLGYVIWAAFIVRVFAFARRSARLAAIKASGCHRQQAEVISKTAALQLGGVIAGFCTTIAYLIFNRLLYFVLWGGWKPGGRWEYCLTWLWRIAEILDSKANLFFSLALSGVLSGALQGGRQHLQQERARLQTLARSRSRWKPSEDAGWEQKVVDLAQRGITLEALLKFFAEDLPQQMPDFDPTLHRTSDVVRRAIIPLSRQAKQAFACVMMEHKPTIPMKMVTHNWSNLFRDLMAAIVADALDEDEFEAVAGLMDRNMAKVVEWVNKSGASKNTYWVCAFSVDQHSGICGANPNGDADTVTHAIHSVCNCGAPKYFNLTAPLYNGQSIGCEMNKFDEMMAYLSAHNPKFSQLIAVDAGFDLFTRAWCVSELAKAHATGMTQRLKLPSKEAVLARLEDLRALRIQDMQASRPEDVAEILAGIPNKEEFNQRLHSLIFDRLIPQWNNLDAREQMSRIGQIARWQAIVNSH